MNGRVVATIWTKEVRDLLRDRKTLFTLLLLPLVLLPLLSMGLGKLTMHMATKSAMEEVIVAADAESRDRYIALAHRAFLASDAARMIQNMQSSLLGRLLSAASPTSTGNPPREIFTDPAVYAEWCRQLAETTRGALRQADIEERAREFQEQGAAVTAMMRGASEEFFEMSIRGVGMVRFVEPDFLTEPEAATTPPNGVLANHERGGAIHHSLVTGAIHGWLEISHDVTGMEDTRDGRVEVILYHDATLPRSQQAASRLRRVIESANRQIVTQRLDQLGIDREFLTPVTVAPGGNIASASRQVLVLFGGILPYLILVFAYMGGMYPAADLGAGEKERQTLETLLLSPVSRFDIAMAKYLVIFFFSLSAAMLGILSMGATIMFLLPRHLLGMLGAELGVGSLLAAGLLAIPPAAAFSGIFLGLSIYARSYREAQNYMAPLAILLVLPAIAGVIPGLEPSWKISLIPLVNVSILCREAVKGSFDMLHYGLAFGSCLLLAMVCVWLAVRLFQREEVLFRM